MGKRIDEIVELIGNTRAELTKARVALEDATLAADLAIDAAEQALWEVAAGTFVDEVDT